MKVVITRFQGNVGSDMSEPCFICGRLIGQKAKVYIHYGTIYIWICSDCYEYTDYCKHES